LAETVVAAFRRQRSRHTGTQPKALTPTSQTALLKWILMDESTATTLPGDLAQNLGDLCFAA